MGSAHLKEDKGYNVGKITIKKWAWISSRIVINHSVTIGEGAVVGTGAVVTKDVPDVAIAYGVPATVRGYRRSNPETTPG